MEEVVDFETWLSTYQPPEIEFVAVYDPNTGAVISVGPSTAFPDEKHILPIDKETATLILEAKIKIHSCFVDLTAQTLEIAEVKSVFKIDDVLHRIISNVWTEIEKPEIYITYDSTEKTLTFEMSEEYSGTFKQDEKFQPVVKRKILWDGDTIMNFLVTDYNDPNVLFKMISFKISDVIDNKKIVNDIDVGDKFSVYTRRIFKNYVIEYK